MLYVADEFSGLSANVSGGTNREHEDSLIAQGFIKPRVKAEIPTMLAYLYEMFNAVRFSVIPIKGVNKLSPRQQLTFTELKSYIEVSGMDLSGVECDVIMQMDSIFNQTT